MTLAQITCFMEVAKYQSFSKAAEHLYISQPAVSKQVSLLEKSLALALTLIDRSYGGAQLTEAGKMFYKFFRKGQDDFSKLSIEAREITSGHTGDLRLGCLDGWDLSTFYPEFRGLLAEKYPKLHVALDGYNHIQVIDALRRKEIDVAITLEITLRGLPDVFRRNVTSAPVVMLISTLHPLAKKKDLTLADFKDDPFYAISPAAGGCVSCGIPAKPVRTPRRHRQGSGQRDFLYRRQRYRLGAGGGQLRQCARSGQRCGQ